MASTARLDELKKKFDENPRRYFAPLANELRKSGDVEQAIALCRTHLPQQPAHISGHIVLGQALFEAGQLDESRDTFQTALELDPENLIALRYLGDIAHTGGDLPAARSWYHRVLEVDPRNDEIEELIRGLDAPPVEATSVRPAADAPGAEPAASRVESVAVAGPPVSDTEPPAANAAPDDSRFAPLAIDEIDAGSDLFSPGVEAAAASTHDAQSHDATVAWSSESPTAEMPVLDVPELDPFGMPASANAESLFDATDASGGDSAGFFLDELTTPNDPVDIGELDAAPADPVGEWDSRPNEEQRASTAAEAPSASASAPEFEDGSFYLEPAPGTPEWSQPVPEPTASAEYARDLVPEVTAAEAQPPAAEEKVSPPESFSWDEPAPAPAVAEAPNVEESLPDLARADTTADAELSPYDAPTAQYETPVAATGSDQALASPPAAADDGLGLEVMEFVPPTSSSVPSAPPAQVPADPLVGHMPELSAPTLGAPPDAFVTETMAELYLQQGFTNEALAVYRELLARNPGDTSLRERIDQIESGSMSSLGMATLSENVVESARRRQTERPSRSVRSFFASLAGRRAPQPPREAEEPTAYDSIESEPGPADDTTTWSEESSATSVQPQAAYGSDGSTAPPESEPTMPAPEASMSAAEQMATFDPFADAWAPAASPEPAAPNDAVEPGSFTVVEAHAPEAPAPETFAAPAPEPFAGAPEPTPAPEPRSAPRSLEELFPEGSATPRADAAAQTLATAFGRAEPPGRPTRAASNELSLDRVFRGAPEGSPPPDGGFSFDQFFSDAPRASGGDAGGAPVTSATSQDAEGGDGGDSHDIEQFTAWLEGLKKK
ncbi:MAG TPA: tetratricopeptide repeat protein [Gemmatimonadaceae bacterium]|jgi:tetratricopeptide (TPR) repeat protein|nr:tetratricopeptide repeat protein [Gemmatimonadaceae bacterium]